MNGQEKREIIKHIKLGTDEVLYYPYAEGKQPLPLRPISSFELDQCFYNSLEYAPVNVADLVIKIKLKLVDKDRDIDISDSGYVKLQKYYDSIDYWIVYYAMKDFQDEDFSILDFNELECFPKGYYIILNKMTEVHKIAKFILESSHKSQEVIEEIFTDENGREVAYIFHYLNIPLSDMIKITKLQRDYLIYSKGELRKIRKGKDKEDKYILSGQEMTLKDFLDKMGVDYDGNG